MLQKLLAVFTIFKCSYWLVDFNLLFSAQSIIYRNDLELSNWRKPVFFLFSSTSETLPMVFLGMCIVASIGILIKAKYARLLFFIIWFAVSNINNRVFCTLSGGDYLFQHFLFFAIFLSGNFENVNSGFNEISKALHNTGVIALRIQLCLVYFLAGYTKILDPDWMDGSAISDAFKIYDYNTPLFYDVPRSLLTEILNYTVVFYQFLFPVLVWIKSIKKWYLVLGIIQHLFIAFAFGLPTFGLIMVLSYSIFYAPGLILKKQTVN